MARSPAMLQPQVEVEVEACVSTGAPASTGPRVPRTKRMQLAADQELELPETDTQRQAELQLQASWSLAEVARGAAEVLCTSGSSLQQATGQTLPLPGHSLGLACSSLGASLVGLGSVLTAEVFNPLEELKRRQQPQLAQGRSQLEQLTRQEQQAASALAESVERKNKASEELQERVKEREQQHQGRKRAHLTRLFKPAQGKVGHRMQHAAQVQTAAVEEMALRADHVAVARLRREEAAGTLGLLQVQAASTAFTLAQTALQRCASAWDEVAESLRTSAADLQAASTGDWTPSAEEVEKSEVRIARGQIAHPAQPVDSRREHVAERDGSADVTRTEMGESSLRLQSDGQTLARPRAAWAMASNSCSPEQAQGCVEEGGAGGPLAPEKFVATTATAGEGASSPMSATSVGDSFVSGVVSLGAVSCSEASPCSMPGDVSRRAGGAMPQLLTDGPGLPREAPCADTEKRPTAKSASSRDCFVCDLSGAPEPLGSCAKTAGHLAPSPSAAATASAGGPPGQALAAKSQLSLSLGGRASATGGTGALAPAVSYGCGQAAQAQGQLQQPSSGAATAAGGAAGGSTSAAVGLRERLVESLRRRGGTCRAQDAMSDVGLQTRDPKSPFYKEVVAALKEVATVERVPGEAAQRVLVLKPCFAAPKA